MSAHHVHTHAAYAHMCIGLSPIGLLLKSRMEWNSTFQNEFILQSHGLVAWSNSEVKLFQPN